MAKFEESVVINRPVEEVFEFTSHPENEPRWNSGLQESEITSEGKMEGQTKNSLANLKRLLEAQEYSSQGSL